jgi:phage tail-like protein
MGSSTTLVTPVSLLSFVADRNNCYPNELLKYYLRFVVPQASGAILQISLPHVMKVEAYEMPEGIPTSLLSLNEVNQEFILQLPLSSVFTAGQSYEMTVSVRVETFKMDQYLLSEARIFDADIQMVAYEAVQTAVFGHGKYLHHLPELYENDDFVDRFLMLIESFWKPINQQIDQMYCNFDPQLTPQTLLPWLSSWGGLPFDESLPVERMRALLKQSMMFSQQRGTFQALKTYLETYTGGSVTIFERRASNFVLGKQGRLGVEIALGTENQPNSIFINVKVPLIELEQTKFSTGVYENKLKEIVRTLIPAHTVCDLICEFVDNENLAKTEGN